MLSSVISTASRAAGLPWLSRSASSRCELSLPPRDRPWAEEVQVVIPGQLTPSAGAAATGRAGAELLHVARGWFLWKSRRPQPAPTLPAEPAISLLKDCDSPEKRVLKSSLPPLLLSETLPAYKHGDKGDAYA